MTDSNHRPQPDTLDAATAALRDAPIPPGPSDDLTAVTLAAMNHRLAGATPRGLHHRRRTIMRVIGFSATAAAVLAAVFLLPGRSPADDVKRAVRKSEAAKTIRLLVEQDDGAGTKLTTKIYKADGVRRTDTEPVGLTVILDEKGQKGVMLFAKQKAYRTLDLGADDPAGRGAKGGYDHNSVCAAFKNLPDNHLKAAADEYLDGRKTKAYEVTDVGFDEGGADFKGKADMKLWVDPKTDLPVRSRLILRLADKTVTSVYTYLGFDEDLDPKLFDTKIPDGYKPLPDGAKLEPKKDK